MAKRNGPSSPASTLPAELLSIIFDFLEEPFLPTHPVECNSPRTPERHHSTDRSSQASDSSRSSSPFYSLGWLVVAGVCKRWRVVALAQKSRPIQLPLSCKSQTTQLLSSLNPLPFTIVVTEDIINVRPALESLYVALEGPGDRLCELSFLGDVQCPMGHPPRWDNPTTVPIATVNSWMTLANGTGLRQLKLSPYYGCEKDSKIHPPYDIVLPRNLIHLEELKIRNCNVLNPESLERSPLRTLEIVGNSNALWTLPSNLLSRLESLSFCHNTVEDGRGNLGEETEKVDMPNLKCLRMDGEISSATNILRRVSFPVDISLTVLSECGGRKGGFVPLLERLQELYSNDRMSGNFFTEIDIGHSSTVTYISCRTPDQTTDPNTPFSRSSTLDLWLFRLEVPMLKFLFTNLCTTILANGENRTLTLCIGGDHDDYRVGDCNAPPRIAMTAVACIRGVEKLVLKDFSVIVFLKHLQCARKRKQETGSGPVPFPDLTEVTARWHAYQMNYKKGCQAFRV